MKINRVLSIMVVALLMALSIAVIAEASSNEYTSSLNYSSDFSGSTRTYWRVPGFNYKGMTCGLNGVNASGQLRLATGFLGAWQSKGAVTFNGINGSSSTVWGYTYPDQGYSGQKNGYYEFYISNNYYQSGALASVYTSTFNLTSHD